MRFFMKKIIFATFLTLSAVVTPTKQVKASSYAESTEQLKLHHDAAVAQNPRGIELAMQLIAEASRTGSEQPTLVLGAAPYLHDAARMVPNTVFLDILDDPYIYQQTPGAEIDFTKPLLCYDFNSKADMNYLASVLNGGFRRIVFDHSVAKFFEFAPGIVDSLNQLLQYGGEFFIPRGIKGGALTLVPSSTKDLRMNYVVQGTFEHEGLLYYVATENAPLPESVYRIFHEVRHCISEDTPYPLTHPEYSTGKYWIATKLDAALVVSYSPISQDDRLYAHTIRLALQDCSLARILEILKVQHGIKLDAVTTEKVLAAITQLGLEIPGMPDKQ